MHLGGGWSKVEEEGEVLFPSGENVLWGRRWKRLEVEGIGGKEREID